MMMIAMLALPFAMQAQTKFHDVEANGAKGPVKSISTSMMGMTRTIEFTEDGQMKSSEISNVVYDENGYLQSATMSMQGQSTDVKYTWEDGRVKSQTINMMGQDIKTTSNYDENGVVTSETIDMGGQKMESPYTDYEFDDHGNWISRKASMMGQEMVTTRTITYYQ
ncbi:hypothetical protein SAMN04487850_0308 [Prevotella aff. ruminicola Tc2-24]|uniref:YD repeat-containing protein n=2 Tax=Prevotellaceae TaxID=171552 RepID=A0A1I0M3W1_9BACT|nr:hypothetical protein SAMN04487828_0302 [Prevotella sp. lc2012]SEV83127.1 hypothetical protein SAMN04487850_0308 [Prevotella aff. ruminicola Tc2-24]